MGTALRASSFSILSYYLKLFIIAITFLSSQNGFGYHFFYSYGYGSCITCHYHPGGSGPLNDYGRALWSTELSSRWYVPQKISDEKLGIDSNFFLLKKPPSWLKPHLKLRYIGIVEGLDSLNSQARKIFMQRDFGSSHPLDSDQSKFFVWTLTYNDDQGRYRTSSFAPQTTNPELRLRDAYITAPVREGHLLILGMQDKPFGIRDANHTLWSRRLPRQTQYDQSFGLLYHYLKDEWEIQAMGFHGNMNEPMEYRLGGLSAFIEYSWSDSFRPGLSLMSQKNDFVETMGLATHLRWNLNYRANLNFEIGQVTDISRPSAIRSSHVYSLIQYFLRISRGIHLLTEFDHYQNLTPNPTLLNQTRIGGHAVLMVLPRSEIRFGLINQNSRLNTGDQSRWDTQTQWHLSW